ncbi:amidase [Promicromonospora sp. Populi]|uniref:amidase n=1 Tax=Promicromonospora sp. Populi TaxID=3239420 RepID=UPI0034E22780
MRNREVSVPELAAASVARIEDTAVVNAFLELDTARALRLAEAYQRLLDDGVDLGPLHGIPLAVKANIDISGVRSSSGSRILAEHHPDQDAAVVGRLKRAGGLMVGTTNMHEFAWGGTTDNPHYGACRNPWDLERIPAGSSGGSGAAAATRSVFAALGTDTGGSVRLPASMNGVTGIRPTIGRVSNAGVLPLAWSMDTVGPIAPSALDCALVLQSIAGYDPADPTTRDVPVEDFLAGIERPLDGLRIAVVDDYSLQGLQPGVEAAFRHALRTFEALGCRIETISLPELEPVVDAQVIIDACEPTAIHLPWLTTRPDDYGLDVRTLLQAGALFSALEYIQAQRYRTHLRGVVAARFQDVDLIATPTIPFTAPLIGEHLVPVDGGHEDTLVGNMKYTALPSMTGMPAISVPCGFDELGLPVGMQLMAAPFQEATLFRAAYGFQRHTAFHTQLPALIAAR